MTHPSDLIAHRCEDCQTCGVHGGSHLKCCGCYDGVCCQDPKAEPSDAQVSAALESYWGYPDGYSRGQFEKMRAALRAAWGVR